MRARDDASVLISCGDTVAESAGLMAAGLLSVHDYREKKSNLCLDFTSKFWKMSLNQADDV